MVDINPNASPLQAQLQAQLQASRAGVRPSGKDLGATPRPQDVIEERIKTRSDERQQDRQLPVKQSNRSNNLSSPQELDKAQARVRQEAANNREAPTGRTSTRQNELRSQPLGQIIDIRV